MPTSIPYDHPSLVLGNVIDHKIIEVFKNIDKCQLSIDAARQKLNSYIMMKRSIAMTTNELIDMNIDVTDIQTKQSEMDISIVQSATDYLSSCIENETKIQQFKEQLSTLEISENLESPIDFSLSKITALPLGSESLKLDSQYFSFGSNQQDDTLASIEKHVRNSTDNLGNKSNDIAKAVSSQIHQQTQNHSIAGTLIITASCTHSNVRLFEPLVFDPDKAITVWNSLYGASEMIDTDTIKSEAIVAKEKSPQNTPNKLTVLTGAGYGSSFVGMVHILNSNSTSSGPSDAIIKQINEKLKIGGWIENAVGGFGVSDSFMNDIETMLSTQNVSAHVSMVVMGAVPSIASNKISLGVEKLSEIDPSLNLMTLSGEKETSESVNSDAEKARLGAQLLTIQNAKTQSLLKGLSKIDHDSNTILDINSMMAAFENYLKEIKNKENNVGVPINFYLKNLTQKEIKNMWLKKYYPIKKTVSENQ
ncbi:hypothetical protein [Aquimarina longa]|uniref:hypothetical protein n=1 Tax=Aquimarina longa TaxID=1080221 RepID=UPI000ABB76A1|nr:hypothetical protein [Aquimarina longa]